MKLVLAGCTLTLRLQLELYVYVLCIIIHLLKREHNVRFLSEKQAFSLFSPKRLKHCPPHGSCHMRSLIVLSEEAQRA